jgi:hypothetical protein
MSVIWSGKPFLKKTIVKFVLVFVVFTIFLSPIFMLDPTHYIFISAWFLLCFIFFTIYYFNKRAYTYFITDKSVRIEKSWVFGNYIREITFDQIKDIHIMQGIFARSFNCGSLVFITSTGLEVGYVGGGAAAGGSVTIGGGGIFPRVIRGRGNTFWDVQEPRKAREVLVNKLAEWREVFQQQKIATSVEKIAERTTLPSQQSATGTIADELEKLKKLLETGAITKEEYEKVKKKLLE